MWCGVEGRDERLQQERLDVARGEVHPLVVNQLLQVLAAAEFKHKVHVRVPAKHVQQLWCQGGEMEALRVSVCVRE